MNFIGEADSEFERLLAEEEEIERHHAAEDKVEIARHHRDFSIISAYCTLAVNGQLTCLEAIKKIRNIVG